jgi:hypothetical protein
LPECLHDSWPECLPECLPGSLPDSWTECLPECLPESLPDSLPDSLPELSVSVAEWSQCVRGQDCPVGASWNGTQCTCNTWFYREHGACVECPLHHICLNKSRRAVAEFDPGLRTLSTRTVLFEDSVCAPGMFHTSHTDVCKPCPRYFFCPSERITGLPNVVRCAENQFTYDTGAESSSECVCLGWLQNVSG